MPGEVASLPARKGITPAGGPPVISARLPSARRMSAVGEEGLEVLDGGGSSGDEGFGFSPLRPRV